MNISSLLSPDAPRGRIPTHQTNEHSGPLIYSSTSSDVPIQAPSPIHPLNQAALWENGGYDVEGVEKAMSKSSSSSSGMGGYYDPIHDQAEPPQITMPVLSPGGRGISLGSLGGTYDPHSSSGIGSSMGPPPPVSSSQHYSPVMVAPLGPPPLSHSLPAMQSHAQQVPLSPPRHHQRHYKHDYDNHHHQHHQHQHHQHHQHHHQPHNASPVKAAYPNVLNESTTQARDHYSQSEWIGQEPAPVKHSGRHYDPLGEHRSAGTSMPEVPQPRRRKRVWEEDSEAGVEVEVEEERVSPPSQYQPNTYQAPAPEAEPAHAYPEPDPEPMDEDNPLQRENKDPPSAAAAPPSQEDDVARIQELKILLERYPLYKPAHLELIAFLRRKYLASGTEESRAELESVRTFASETMQVGEQAWLEWIEDEDRACQDLEGRLKVINICSKAVEEQPMSSRLWKVYADQLEVQYRRGVAAGRQNGSGEGDDMDEMVGEVFTWDMLIGVYAQAVEAIKDHIPESQLLWDRYLELLTEDLEAKFSESTLQQTRDAFLTRLKTPHSNIDTTFSAYSTFVTNYENASYEKIMVSTNKIYAASQAKYSDREMYELQLRRAIEAVDESGTEENTTAEWYAWKSYLDWELSLPKKKLEVELVMALFERAVMRYDYRGETMWEWYLDFLAEKANRSPRILPILERAVHAFPALPSLWSRYLIAMEARFKSAEEMEKVKNRAIDALSKVGEEQLLEVCYAWAGVSKRRILAATVTEEESMVLLKELREYMKEFRDLDSQARLDRLYIALCSQMQPPDVDSARKTWKGIVAHEARAKLAKLWLGYYRWEFQWGTKAAAGAILRHACSKAATIDNSEAIFEAYMAYVTEWGDTTDVEEASWKLRRWREKVPLVTAVATTAVTAQPAQAAPVDVVGEVQAASEIPAVEVPAAAEERTPAKRRRSITQDEYPDSPPNKKSKPEHQIQSEDNSTRQAREDGTAPKRDRENTTVIVRNLPLEIKEIRLRQFFRDCGKINSLKIVPEAEKKTATATIEFESLMDVLSAQTKDMKSIDGHEIEVQVGAGSTLYVTNFPPVADEEYIRNLFKEFGEIVDIRFPSLKFNTHRRFCYVQFLSADAARNALSLHGRKLGPKEKLIVKISDPNAKQERSGPVYEGREVFLRNVDFKANEEMIKEVFEREVGQVESIRLPSKVPGKHQGFGFVVFTKKEDAQRAASEFDDKLVVGGGERKLSIRVSESKRPGPGTGQAVAVATGEEGSPASGAPVGEEGGKQTSSPLPPPSMDIIKKKTLVILNLPDTINDTRLREVFSKYGPLRKVQLRPEHGGAVVEFVEVKDAGKAELGLVGYKFGRGMEGMKFGRLEELLKQKGVVRKEEEVPGGKKEKGKGGEKSEKDKGSEKVPVFAPRSVVGGAAPRGGLGAGRRRGGLGFVGGPLRRREGGEEKKEGGEEKESVSGSAEQAHVEAPAPRVKSNADFKAMFLKK